MDQAHAQLEASTASMNGTRADLERAKVDAEGPDVPLLKRAYDRAKGMAKEGVVSASALDDAQKNYEMSLNKQNVSQGAVAGSASKDRPGSGTGGAGSRKPEAAGRATGLHDDYVSDRWHRSFARRRDGRCGQLDSRSRFVRHAR